MKERLKQDAENMLQVMDRTAGRSDIWQDRCVYWMAVAIYHIIVYLMRKENNDHA